MPPSIPLTAGQQQALLAFFDEIDSHGIWHEEFVIPRLAMCGIHYHNETWHLAGARIPNVYSGFASAEEHTKAMHARGLGGSVKPGTWRGVTGYILAEQICALLGLGTPGAPYYGRGKVFYACVEAIRQATPTPPNRRNSQRRGP